MNNEYLLEQFKLLLSENRHNEVLVNKMQDFISTIEAMDILKLDVLCTLHVYETLGLISITPIYSEYIDTIKDIKEYIS